MTVKKAASRSKEDKSIARKIRSGELPRYHLAKSGGIDGHLERATDPKSPFKTKRTWRMVSTYAELTKKGDSV